MMRKRFTPTLLGLALVFLLSVPMVVTAGGKAEKVAPTATEATGPVDWSQFEDHRNSADPDQFPKNEAGVPIWPWEESRTTLRWFLNYPWFSSTIWKPNETLLHQLILEETGIDLELVIPPSGEERLNAMIAANDLPDVITIGQTSAQMQLLIGANRLMALNELSAQHNPDFFGERLPRSIIDWFTSSDGNVYQLPNEYEAAEHIREAGDRYSVWVNVGAWARQEWMHELGISPNDFATQQGTIEALRKVRDANLTYRGQQVIPALIGHEGGIDDTFGYVLPSFFGIPREDRNGNFVDFRFHPKTLEMIKFGNQLVAEGLVIRENLTAPNSLTDEWRNGGLVFLGLRGIGGSAGGLVQNEDPNWTAVPVEMPRASDGGDPVILWSALGYSGTAIPTSSRYPQQAIRMLDYMYSNPVFMNFALEGVVFDWQPDGRISFLPEFAEVRSRGWQPAADKYGTDRWYWTRNITHTRMVSPPPADRLGQNQLKMRESVADFVYPTNAFSNINPPAGTPEVEMNSQIADIWAERLVQMLVAPANQLERMYMDTLAMMKSAGHADVLRVQNERFQTNKQRLGVDRAWPADRLANPGDLHY